MIDCLDRARQGDRTAADRLAAALRPRLTRMAAHYARRCGEDPEDLLQEAWVGLLEALPSLDVRIGSPEQYLLQRARWRLLDWVKRSRLRRCARLDAGAEEGVRLFESASTGDGLSETAVRDFLRRLNPMHRRLLGCLLAGLTWRETGRVLGCTSANVAYHMRRIRSEYHAWMEG